MVICCVIMNSLFASVAQLLHEVVMTSVQTKPCFHETVTRSHSRHTNTRAFSWISRSLWKIRGL